MTRSIIYLFLSFCQALLGNDPRPPLFLCLSPAQPSNFSNEGNGTRDQIDALQNKIVLMQELAQRAHFTPEELKRFNTMLAGFEEQLAVLQKEKTRTPTFNEWIRDGKKIPPGMMFTGGSPWFNETTGLNRQPREVYEIIYRTTNTPTHINPKPAVSPSRSPLNTDKTKAFPIHWGDPPKRQTRDLRPLPGGYGMGSGTLARWIQENLDRDKK